MRQPTGYSSARAVASKPNLHSTLHFYSTTRCTRYSTDRSVVACHFGFQADVNLEQVFSVTVLGTRSIDLKLVLRLNEIMFKST